MASHRRRERIEDLLLEVVSEIYRKLKDTGIPSEGIVSFTGISVSPDLGHATVRYSYLGDESNNPELQAALERSSGFFRREINKVVRLRKIPELKFVPDLSLKKGADILSLIQQVERSDEASKLAGG